MSNQLRASTRINQNKLSELVRAGSARHHLTVAVSQRQHHTVPVTLQLADSTVFNVGRILVDADVELRRAGSYLTFGSLRPLKGSDLVVLKSAEPSSSITITLLTSQILSGLLTSRPFDFLLILSWMWEHRLNRTRTHFVRDETHHLQNLNQIFRNLSECLENNQPAIMNLSVGEDGSTRIELRPFGATPQSDRLNS